jgi:hypothetical protein
LQLVNIQAGLQQRLTQLEANPATPGAPSHISAINALLTLIGKRLAPTSQSATTKTQTMLPSVPARVNVIPSPLYVQPKNG